MTTDLQRSRSHSGDLLSEDLIDPLIPDPLFKEAQYSVARSAADQSELELLAAIQWADGLKTIEIVANALQADASTTLNSIRVRSPAGPVRDAWVQYLRASLTDTAKLVCLPAHMGADRLVETIDLAATLAEGRPVMSSALFDVSAPTVFLVRMADCLSTEIAGLMATCWRQSQTKTGGVPVALVLLDESLDDEPGPPHVLADHMSLDITLPGRFPPGESAGSVGTHEAPSFPPLTDEIIQSIDELATRLDVPGSDRRFMACRAAQWIAALGGRESVGEGDIEQAARLSLLPSARRMPVAGNDPDPTPPEPPPEERDEPSAEADPQEQNDQEDVVDNEAMLERLVEIAAAARLQLAAIADANQRVRQSNAHQQGRSGDLQNGAQRGRVIATRKGKDPRRHRLDLLATLRTAAPWQSYRGRSVGAPLVIRKEDLCTKRYQAHRETAILFLVDASGSSAIHRMAEAKGAVEGLLSSCYARRDYVSVIAFKGQGADLLLPSTRSVARARRALAGLPGGGGTPTAKGLKDLYELARLEQKKGRTVQLVILTDGKSNIDLEGHQGREQAHLDAVKITRLFRAQPWQSLFVDTGTRPGDQAAELARNMGARYLPMPYVEGGAISEAVRQNL
ncbi:MAG: VWA domain-containing protein [Pseudomonadota bacterium]